MVAPINEYTLEDNTVFSIVGKGLKLNTAADVQEFVDTINQMDNLQVIKLSGNTIGVEAGQALGEALKTKTHLKVDYCYHHHYYYYMELYSLSTLFLFFFTHSKLCYPTSLRAVCCLRSLSPSRPCVMPLSR